MKTTSFYSTPAHKFIQQGLTLIELMIAMVLGLVVLGGVVSIISANSQTYRTNEGLSQVQESTRTAFELLARDIRQGAATGCGNLDRVANTLNPGTNWWQEWAGIRGYNGSTVSPAVNFVSAGGNRIDGTDAILLQGIQGTGLSVESHTVTSANFKINATTTDFTEGDILMVCDFDHSAILQVTNYNPGNVTLVHNQGSNPSPGNCSKGLGFPTDCSSSTGNSYQFGPNSQIARMMAVTWYIGDNGRPNEGGRSLFRVRLGPAGVTQNEEIVAGVTDMQLAYREGSATTLTAAPTSWNTVNAVEITLTVRSADRRVSADAGVNEGRLQRTFTTMVGLRNRME